MNRSSITLLGVSLIILLAPPVLAQDVLPDYLEPNGTDTEYTLLTPGSATGLTLHDELDEDYFHLLFPGVDGTLILEIDYVGADGDLALQYGSDGYWNDSEVLGSAGHISAAWPTDPFGQDDLRIFSPTAAAIPNYDIDFAVLYPDLDVQASYLPGHYSPGSTLQINAVLTNLGGHISAETRSDLLSATIYLTSYSAESEDILLSHADSFLTSPGPWDIAVNRKVPGTWQPGAYYLAVDYTDFRQGDWFSQSWTSSEPDILIAPLLVPEPSILALMLIAFPALLRRKST